MPDLFIYNIIDLIIRIGKRFKCFENDIFDLIFIDIIFDKIIFIELIEDRMSQVIVAVIIIHNNPMLCCHLLFDHKEELPLIGMLKLDLIIIFINDIFDFLVKCMLFFQVFIDDYFHRLDNGISSFWHCDKGCIGKINTDLCRDISCLLWFQSHLISP